MKKILATTVALGMIAMAGNAMATNLITNGDFETGNLDGWAPSCIPGGATVVDTGTSFGYAALLNDPTSAGYEGLFQDFYIPTGIDKVTINFDYLFTGVDENCWLDDEFDATFSFLQEVEKNFLWCEWTENEWTEKNLVSASSSDSNYNAIMHFEGTFNLTDLVDKNPNATLDFWLTERLWGLCNFGDLDSAVYLDNVCVWDANDPNPCPVPVPEPATMLLFGTGLIGLVGYRRRKGAKV